MSRTWVYERMSDSASLAALVSTRIFQATSLDSAPEDKPFVVYRQTSDVRVMRGDDGDQCRRVGFMVFAHDTPGDYLQIDAILEILRTEFADVVDQANNIIRSEWLETSDDYRDDDMGTIMKFARVQVTYRL